MIAELRASRLDDERGWIERLVAKRQKLRRSALRLQTPWMFRRTVSSPARLPFASHFLPPKRSSSAVLDCSLESALSNDAKRTGPACFTDSPPSGAGVLAEIQSPGRILSTH